MYSHVVHSSGVSQPSHLTQHAIHSCLHVFEFGYTTFLALDVGYKCTKHSKALSTCGPATNINFFLVPWARKVLIQSVEAAMDISAKIALISTAVPRCIGGYVGHFLSISAMASAN